MNTRTLAIFTALAMLSLSACVHVERKAPEKVIVVPSGTTTTTVTRY